MRVVTREVVSAFLSGKSKKVGNTSTNGTSLFLFGKLIAWKGKSDWGYDAVFLKQDCRNSRATRDRWNGLIQLMPKYGYEAKIKRVFCQDFFLKYEDVKGFVGNFPYMPYDGPFECGWKSSDSLCLRVERFDVSAV